MFDIGVSSEYFDHNLSKQTVDELSESCYQPTLTLFEKLIKKHKDQFKVSISITGTMLEQLEQMKPEIIDQLQKLAKTKQIEFLAQTYYHTPLHILESDELEHQIQKHSSKVESLFGLSPRVFQGTHLDYSDKLMQTIEQIGLHGMLVRQANEDISKNHVYKPKNTQLKLLFQNNALSTDIADRFTDANWDQYPLTATKYATWIDSMSEQANIVNLVFNISVFADPKAIEAGIHAFFETLPAELLDKTKHVFVTVSEALDTVSESKTIDLENHESWKGVASEAAQWVTNKMQHAAMEKLRELSSKIKQKDDETLINDWRRLSSSDHFHAMSTEMVTQTGVRKHQVLDSPYETYIAYMNVLKDMEARADAYETPLVAG